MSLNDFEIIKRLGEGAYSSVYHVRRIADHEYYALKKVRMMKLSDKEKENALNEVRILASIHHNNIIAYKEAFIDDASQSLCIVMEYADNGDLFQQITDHQKNNTLFKEDDIWRMFIQMVRGLKCLHEILIFHRDLKSANVFLNKDGSAKLGDMNVSKVAKKGMLYTQTGTPYYASPEVWRDQPYDNKSDIWSLGCVLYESITLKPPFRADDMQGLFKKVLRGVYPKIPNIYSTDLANLVKALIQVTPQMRPSCDRILEMPIVRKRLEKLFPHDEFYQSQSSLLNTIRVPKNLLYLTDRLPKPSYESPTQKKKMDEEERIRRKTHDAGGMLPEIKNQRKSKNGGDVQMPPSHQATGNQQQLSSQGTGTRRKGNQKSVRVRSDLRDSSQLQEGAGGDESGPNKIATASQQAAEEDRRSVVSKGSVSQSQAQAPLQKEPSVVLRKNSTKRSQQQQAISQRHQVKAMQRAGINEEYEDDQFERDEIAASSPPLKIHHHGDDRESYQDSHVSPAQISPQTKRSNMSKHQVASMPPQQLPNPQMMLLQNRPSVLQSNNPGGPSGLPMSVERIYKGPSALPSLADQGPQQQSRKNLAYINISGEGAKPVGYLGLKKAEKDLIMRRYKYNHHTNDHIQRVAMIYGNGSHANAGGGGPSYQYSYQSGANNSMPPQQQYSPYLVNQMPANLGSIPGSNISGIIKRNKYAPNNDESQSTVASSGIGGQGAIRLPKLPSIGRQNLDHNGVNQQSQAMLPPLGGSGPGSMPSISGQSIVAKPIGQQYHPYIVKPTKLKSIPKPLLVPSQGISGEKININKYGGSIIDRSLNGSETTALPPQPVNLSRANNHLQSLGSNSGGGNAGTVGSQQQASTDLQQQREVRKLANNNANKRRTKPSASVGAAGQPINGGIGTRNALGAPGVGILNQPSGEVVHEVAASGDTYEE